MQYGGQDLELGERLVHCGIRGKSIRYSAICVHLEHTRSYRTPEMKIRCRAIRAETPAAGDMDAVRHHAGTAAGAARCADGHCAVDAPSR